MGDVQRYVHWSEHSRGKISLLRAYERRPLSARQLPDRL